MGAQDVLGAQEAPDSAKAALDEMGEAFGDEPTQLSAKESNERTNEIEATFGKIADFNSREKKIKKIEKTRIASIIKIDIKLDPMKAEMKELLDERKRAPKDEEIKKKMNALEEKIEPLNIRRRGIVANYNKKIDGKLFPRLVATVKAGGSGNATLAGKMKKSVNVYENLRAVNKALQEGPKPAGLALPKDDLMVKQQKLAKMAEDYWYASPVKWSKFKKKIDSIDKAFTQATSGIEAAKRG